MFLSFTWPVITKHEHRLLALVLITLHLALWWNFAPLAARLLLVMHFSLFIVWQPLWSRREPPSLKNSLLLGGSVLIVVLLFNAFNIWLLTLWQITLLGLISGRDLAKPNDRLVNILAIIFLVLDLLLLNTHQLFILGETTVLNWLRFDSHWLLRYGLLIVPLSFLFISAEDAPEYRYYIDFFHGLTFVLLTGIIILSSVVVMYQGQMNYPIAVFSTTVVMALFILLISWVWFMSAGESSLNQLWTRHLLNIGSPVEQWLDNLVQPAGHKAMTPQKFLYSGFEQLTTLPWISGVAWRSIYGEGMRGEENQEQVTITVQSIEVTVFSRYHLSAGHYFHTRILIQLLEYFHQSKRRDEAFAQQAHLQAIHETGAKLTHDIRNLLQSLQAITSAIETCQPDQFSDTHRLLQGQMPRLAQRLKRTLEKLQKPADLSYTNAPVTLWWENLRARYDKRTITFTKRMEIENALIPENLFDNVVENLLQNALKKREHEPTLHIKVELHINKKRGICLTVCDDGTSIPEDVAKNLLTQPVHSRDGFGIGLYHAAKQIAHTGYSLILKENGPDGVCFKLSNIEEETGPIKNGADNNHSF